MAFSSRADLHQGTAAQEALNKVAHSGPISNSDYIGQPARPLSGAQCKRPAQYPPYWAGLLLLAASVGSLFHFKQPGNVALWHV
jgi:hypothetical protein